MTLALVNAMNTTADCLIIALILLLTYALFVAILDPLLVLQMRTDCEVPTCARSITPDRSISGPARNLA